MTYFDGAKTCRTITLSDLSNVMHGISGKSMTATNNGTIDTTSETLHIGEHIVAFCNENGFQWYLGVIDHFDENDYPWVSYMIRSSLNKSEWVFPEKAEILKTTTEQIMAKKVQVDYKCSVRIRCSITSQELITTLNMKIQELNDAS